MSSINFIVPPKVFLESILCDFLWFVQKLLVFIVFLGVCAAAVVEIIDKPNIQEKSSGDELTVAETGRQFGGGYGGL